MIIGINKIKLPQILPPKRLHNSSRGFTIIELMIATSVFSMVLLVAGTGVIAIGRIYFKNINSTRVQEVARSAMEDATRSLQFSSGNVGSDFSPNSKDLKVRCFGNDRFSYVLNDPSGINENSYGFRVDRTPSQGCVIPTDDATAISGDARQLLGNNMRLLQFDVSPGASGTFRIKMKVAYGDNDLLTIYDNNGTPVGWNQPINPGEEPIIAGALCKNGAGNTFCSVAGLETSVNSRIME